MKLGFVSDSFGGMSFSEMMDHAARMGVSGVEINTCGWSTAPHCKMDDLLGKPDAQRAFQAEFDACGLDIISFNTNGNPLHSTDPKQGEDLKKTIHLADEMGVKTVCTMSGLPAGSASDTMPNWVVSSWPPETQDILRYQWEEKLIPFWTEITGLAKDSGVEKIALELHGNQCVYNVPSLRRLREAVGSVIGANLDPSHLFWMGADPLIAAEALGEAAYHVHAKDTFLNAPVQATTSLLENGLLNGYSGAQLVLYHAGLWAWRRMVAAVLLSSEDGRL